MAVKLGAGLKAWRKSSIASGHGAIAPWSKYRYKKSVLSNGVRIVTENHPNAVATSVGLLISKGTRDEAPDESGLAHFVEHMVFKGTRDRSAFEISRDMEAVGADINAYTSRETTSFVGFGLPEHMGRSVDVLCDLVTRPAFASADVKTERDVVIQEIRSSEDLLEDCVYDRHFEKAFANTSLAQPILGHIDSISQMTRERVLRFYRKQYVNQNLVIAAAGKIDHDDFCEKVERSLSPLRGHSRSGLPAGTGSDTVQSLPFSKVIRRQAEQGHVLIGAPSPSFRDHRRFDALILNGILGGGLTSRLYQEIREKRGLAYTAYSQLYSFVDAGSMLMYAATEPKKVPDTVEVVLDEILKLKRLGFQTEEMEIARTQIRASTILNSDDPENRMQSIGINEIVFGRYRPIGEILGEYERVKRDGVMALAEETLKIENLGVTLMGPLPEKPVLSWLEDLRSKKSKVLHRNRKLSRGSAGSREAVLARKKNKKSQKKSQTKSQKKSNK